MFVCRSGGCPTLIMDALARRELPFGQECEMNLLLLGIEIDEDTRRWERLGATAMEVIGN